MAPTRVATKRSKGSRLRRANSDAGTYRTWAVPVCRALTLAESNV
jgi:hypothetical protein